MGSENKKMYKCYAKYQHGKWKWKNVQILH